MHGEFAPRLAQPRALALACTLALASFSVGAQAATAPSAGAIQKQIETAPPLPTPPAASIALPQPEQQRSESRVEIDVRTITIHGNTLLPSSTLHALVREAEGHRWRLGQLQSMVTRLTDAYHRAGYPLAYAYIPAQQVRGGDLRVDVVEPTYGRVTVHGPTRLRTGVALRTVGVKPGQTIAQASLTRGLILLSQTPGVRAHAVFSPGATPKTSDLQLDVSDQPMLSGSLSAANSGNRDVGRTLYGGNANLRNPFGYGSSIGVNAMGSDRGDARLAAGGFTVDSPYLHDGLRVGAYASSTVYHLGNSFAALNESGRAKQAGIDTTYPLLLAPGRSLVARLDLQRNWLDQTTATTSTESTSAISIAKLAISGSYADAFGGVLQGNVSLSHGTLRIAQAAAQALDESGPRTAGTFNVLAMQLDSVQPLPAHFSLLTKVSGQLSDRNLDSSQKFYLGGPNGVIAYDVGDGAGDDGYLADLELSHPLALGRLPGQLRGALLLQAGSVRVNHDVYAAYVGRNTLAEAGVGARLDYAWQAWSVSASYGKRIGSYAKSGAATDGSGQFWLSLFRRF
jgi:hemolysin activation/secretion protein